MKSLAMFVLLFSVWVSGVTAAEIKETDVFESDDAILYSSEEDMVQYYVTKPSHPAHPYMVKSKVLGRREGSRFEVTGYGDVDSAARDWMKEIEDINERKVLMLRRGF